jgi:hypothetical protein
VVRARTREKLQFLSVVTAGAVAGILLGILLVNLLITR